MIDVSFLTELTETPSVGTACRPVLNLLAKRFGPESGRIDQADAFTLIKRIDAPLDEIEAVVITHVDEVGGAVYHELSDGEFFTRTWGNHPGEFAISELQAFDWLASDADTTPIKGRVAILDGEPRLLVRGDGLRPYRTAFTFRTQTEIQGDDIFGKALDPRLTVYAATEAVRSMNDPRVANVYVLAEECSMDVARKATVFLQRHCPNLKLIVNADVPALQNLAESHLDLPAIRIFEGRNFIDPSFGIGMSDALSAKGIVHHLTASRSGSQTLLFTPLAPTISVALPADGMHVARYRMSLTGLTRCQALIRGILDQALDA